MTKNYTVIENTPGYLPEDDDPPTFDSYAEALRYLVEKNAHLADEEFVIDRYDDQFIWGKANEVGPIENGWFEYYSLPKSETSLPRYVEIVPIED